MHIILMEKNMYIYYCFHKGLQRTATLISWSRVQYQAPLHTAYSFVAHTFVQTFWCKVLGSVNGLQVC